MFLPTLVAGVLALLVSATAALGASVEQRAVSSTPTFQLTYRADVGEANNLTVRDTGSGVSISDQGVGVFGVRLGSGQPPCRLVDARTTVCDTTRVVDFVSVLGDGNDRADVALPRTKFVDTFTNGGPGADVISNGDQADSITGGLGGDTVKAGGGGDFVNTGDDGEPDVVDCGPDADRWRKDLKDRPAFTSIKFAFPLVTSFGDCERIEDAPLNEHPTVRIASHTLRVTRGKAAVRLSCPRDHKGRRCRGRLSFAGRLGSARFSIRRGRAKIVRIRVGRRVFRGQPSVVVQATATERARGGRAKTTTAELTLRA
jgi:hypothetical protein